MSNKLETCIFRGFPRGAREASEFISILVENSMEPCRFFIILMEIMPIYQVSFKVSRIYLRKFGKKFRIVKKCACLWGRAIYFKSKSNITGKLQFQRRWMKLLRIVFNYTFNFIEFFSKIWRKIFVAFEKDFLERSVAEPAEAENLLMGSSKNN